MIGLREEENSKIHVENCSRKGIIQIFIYGALKRDVRIYFETIGRRSLICTCDLKCVRSSSTIYIG